VGKSIKIKNIGAIAEAEIPYLPGGGVIELVGPQGCGKSTTLVAIDSLTGSKDKLPLRDHAPQGAVEGFGVSINLKSRTTRTGQPEVASLDSSLSVSDIVNPGIADPAAADARRLEALVRLAGIQPTREMFLPIFDGDEAVFEAVIPFQSISNGDLVSTAKRVRTQCQIAARSEEAATEHLKQQLAQLESQWKDVDLDACHDEAHLKSGYLAAVKYEADMLAAVKFAESHAEAVANAREKIAEFDARPGKSAARAAAELVIAKAHREACARVHQKAAADLAAAENAESAAHEQERFAIEREQQLGALRQLIESSKLATHSAESIEKASADRARAEARMETGRLVRLAIEAKQKDAPLQREIDRSTSVALQLRHAAAATDRVVSEAFAVLGTPLRVDNDRLMINTSRGPTPFADLSDGERWKLALDIAIGCVGANGIMTIPQSAWGELQPANKKAIADRLRSCNVLAYTCVATDGAGLSAREFDE